MMRKEDLQKTKLIFFGFFLLAVAFLLATYQYQSEKKKTTAFLYPPEFLKHSTMGYKDPLADSLWIRVIQDIGFCDQTNFSNDKSVDQSTDQSSSMIASHTENEAGTQHRQATENVSSSTEKLSGNIKDQVNDVLDAPMAEAKCRMGWVYSMIDTITELAPKFDLVYRVGATILSILVDDREGARRIFEKGIQQFPDDWSLAYRAGYHYLYEMKDPRRAAELLEHAGRKGAPPWVFSLAARLYTDLGRAELGITILEDALKREYKGHGTDKIKQRLEQLYKIRDAALQKEKAGK